MCISGRSRLGYTAMNLDRRSFLKLVGAAGAVALPTLLGYDLLHSAEGESPPDLSPYAPVEILETWPTDPAEASPILLLISGSADNPFGLYLGEILRAEGLNCFQIGRIEDLSNAPLQWYDEVLLTEMSLTAAQVALLEAFVAGGGNLVSMRSDTQLVSLLGVEAGSGVTPDGYLQVATHHTIGQGIPGETLQYHGIANHYSLNGAEAVAWLFSDAANATGYPAVTFHRYGRGYASLWAFDLARSIAYMRQGKPDWANQERDGGEGIRAVDMFDGWIDLDRIAIPQADVQQRLLVNLLAVMSQNARPLPRLWYFPGRSDAVFIATSDSHGNPAVAVESILQRVENFNGHMSIYYTPFPSRSVRRAVKRGLLQAASMPVFRELISDIVTSPSPYDVADWRARGHEFALHPYVEVGTSAGWVRQWQEFTGLGYGPVPPTVRTHRTLWDGWVETARLQASYGMKLNLDYYHWGPSFRLVNGEWVYGYLTGSGLPMRFVDEHGTIMRIYQQLTQLADDHILDLRWGTAGYQGFADAEAGEAIHISEDLIRSSLTDHCAITANLHTDQYDIASAATDEASHKKAVEFLEGTLSFAAEMGVPIWSAEMWLRFTEFRYDARVTDVQWLPAVRQLSLLLDTELESRLELTVMIPKLHRGHVLSGIFVDGSDTEFREVRLGAITYGCISVSGGRHQLVGTYA